LGLTPPVKSSAHV